MPPRPTDTCPNAGEWSMLFDGLGLDEKYHPIILQIAVETWAVAHPNEEMPDIEEPDAILEGLREGRRPDWWPSNFPRLNARIRVTQNHVTFTYGPSIFEARGRDQGLSVFRNHIKMLSTQAPNPFYGNLQVDILMPNGSGRGGFNGTVRVGAVLKGGASPGGLGTEEDEPWVGVENAYLRKEMRRTQDANLAMFGMASNVIQASASVIAATKGVKDDEGNEGGAWWEKLAVIGAGIAEKFVEGREEGDNKKEKKGAAQIPERPQLQLPDNQYPREIDPAGPPADEWGHDPVPEADADEVDPEDPEDEEESTQADADADEDNPLHGKSPEEVRLLMEAWIEQQPDKKKVRKMGMTLAKKFF